MPKPKNKNHTDYEKLGRMLQNIYESGYADRNQAYKFSFLKGVLGGLGGVIGATIVVAIMLWLLSIFNNIPLVGPFVDNLRDTVEQRAQ